MFKLMGVASERRLVAGALVISFPEPKDRAMNRRLRIMAAEAEVSIDTVVRQMVLYCMDAK